MVVTGVTVFESGGVFVCAGGAARCDASLVENMRVNRFLTEPFSAGFERDSVVPFGTGWPDCPASWGDLADMSKDLIGDGCDALWDEVVFASELLAMVKGCKEGDGVWLREVRLLGSRPGGGGAQRWYQPAE